MSGSVHHPLDRADVESGSEPEHRAPSSDPSGANAPDESGWGGPTPSGPAAWTTGLEVESAADIAARQAGDARFAHPHPGSSPDPGRESGAASPVDSPTSSWADDSGAAGVSEQGTGWVTSQLVREHELPAEPGEPDVPDSDSPQQATEPAGHANNAASTDDTDSVADAGPVEEEPTHAMTDIATVESGPIEPTESTELAPDGAPTKVNLSVWVDDDLRRRLRAAHAYTGDDEGYATLSDYVATVLKRDVERIERTYNDGAAFPAEEEPGLAPTETYEVRARFGEGLWELRIADVGVTLSPTLAGAETMARTYISVLHGVPVDSVSVAVVPELDGDLGPEIARSRKRAARAEEAVLRAEEMLAAARAELAQVREDRHHLIRRLSDAGLSAADIDTAIALVPDA